MIYRPWGNIHKILPKFDNISDWIFWGCISPEDRTVAAFLETRKSNYSKNITKYYFTNINDPNNQSSEIIHDKLKRKNEHIDLIKSYNLNPIIGNFDLQYTNDEIIYEYIHQIINVSSGNILLDISCFPKKYFFPIIKFILWSDKIDNFIVLNTLPMQYREGYLSGDFAEWKTIPFFPDMEPETVKDIVLFSVGHMPMADLESLQEIYSSPKVKLFFPFPGNLQSYKLSWEFVFNIKNSLSNKENIDLNYVNALDPSELYDNLIAMTNIEDLPNKKTSLIAPYGPKPFSLAMAIFASKYDIPVYYTQPRLYYPDYSIGIGEKNGIVSVNAYCIVIKKRMIY
jgi:hypothetical protein